MHRGNCFSTRSGGDALKQREGRSALLQGTGDKLSTHSLNAANGLIKIDRHGAARLDWIEKVAFCPVYYPTDDEFVDPLHYIQKIAPKASEYGICKVVPPVVATVPAGVVLTKEQTNFKFTTMIQPMRLPNWDKEDRNTFYMSGCHYTLAEYEKVANKEFARKFSTAAALPAKFIEAEFWKELVSGKTCSVEYANDVDGSAFSKSCMDPLGQSKWNLKKLSRLPSSTLRLLSTAIPGVTEPMLYIGMLFSMFGWHVEDHYLYSINYHHCGAPKTWYGVPGKSAPEFENIVEKHVYQPELLKDAGKGLLYNLLLQKTTMFAPKLLSEHGVPVFRALQNPGEFVITFPRAYHAGFSHGFNCGEAVNFAMADWFPFGAAACLRYEFLNRMPLLPHEELLCKEAMLVSPEGLFSCSSQVYKQQSHVKRAFVALMRSHLKAHEELEKRGAKAVTSSFMNILCGLCKHACYIAYSSCSCYPKPTCLNHDQFFGSCTCGSLRALVVREDLPKLQGVAQLYESENELFSEDMKEPSIFDACVANAGIGTGEEDLMRSLLFVPKTSDGLNAPFLAGEKRPTLRENDSVANVKAVTDWQSLESNQLQEDSSDTEAFRVKRRRVSHSCGKRFQVDEQDVELSIDTKPEFYLEASVKTGKPEPRCVFVRDVMNKLGIKGPKVEVIGRWQHCARTRGLAIKTKWVPSAGRLVEALSFKSCMVLKQLLTKDHAWRLEMLMKQAPRCLSAVTNPSCGTHVDSKPLLMAAPFQKGISDRREAHKAVDKNKWQTGQDCVAEDKAVDSSVGFVEKDACLHGKYYSDWNSIDKMPVKRNPHSGDSSRFVAKDKPDLEKQLLKGNSVSDTMLGKNSKHPTRNTSIREGLSKSSEFRCRKGTQSVGRLRIKLPMPCMSLEGRKCVPRITEDDARCAGLNCQQELHSTLRNVTDLSTEKRISKEQGKETAQVTVEANPKKMHPVYFSKKVGQERATKYSGNVYKKSVVECGIDDKKASARDMGLLCAKEPIGSSAVDFSLEQQKVDLTNFSGISCQLLPMTKTSNSIKDSNMPLCSKSEEGEVRDESSDRRGHVIT